MGEKRTPTKNMGFWMRLKLRCGGRVYLGHRMRPGWRPPGLPFYLIRCKEHGLVENRISGLADDVNCPRCQDERDERMDQSSRATQ